MQGDEITIAAIDWRSLLVPKLPLADVVLRTVVIYLLLQVGLRFLGRKNLQYQAPYNTVTLFLVGAFGGRAVLGEDTSMTSCALGLGVVLALNAATAWGVYHSRCLSNFFEGPAVRQLICDGVLQENVLRANRCSQAMLEAQLRSRGETDLGRVRHAFVERTGEITFILW